MTFVDKQNDLFLFCANVPATWQQRENPVKLFPVYLYYTSSCGFGWRSDAGFSIAPVRSTLSAMGLRVLKTFYFREDRRTLQAGSGDVARRSGPSSRPGARTCQSAAGKQHCPHGRVWVINSATSGPILASCFMTRVGTLTELLLHFGYAAFQPRVS